MEHLKNIAFRPTRRVGENKTLKSRVSGVLERVRNTLDVSQETGSDWGAF